MYVDMRPRQLPCGAWAVVEVAWDRTVIAGFASHADAWRWLDLNTSQGRGDLDRFHRVRRAFA